MIKIKRLATNIIIPTNQCLVIPRTREDSPRLCLFSTIFPTIFLSRLKGKYLTISTSIFIASQFRKRKISIKNVGHVLESDLLEKWKTFFFSVFLYPHSQTSESLFATFLLTNAIYFPTQILKTSLLSSLSFFFLLFFRAKGEKRKGKIILLPCEIYTVLDWFSSLFRTLD
jgi:hypothetical protein